MKEINNFNFLNAFKAFTASDLTEATQINNDSLWIYAKENNSLVPFELIDALNYTDHRYACAYELEYNPEGWNNENDYKVGDFIDEIKKTKNKWKTTDEIIIVSNELLLPIDVKKDEQRRGLAISMGSLLQVIALGCRRKLEEWELELEQFEDSVQ